MGTSHSKDDDNKRKGKGGFGIDIDINKPKIDISTSGKMKKQKERCPMCENKFGFFRSKCKCDECGNDSCSSCTSKHKFSVLGWEKPKLICKGCLPKLKLKVDEIAKNKPKLADKARKESMQVDVALSGGSIEFNTPELEFDEKEQKSIEKGKLKCSRCDHKFGLFRPALKCSNCKEIVCNKCTHKFKFIFHILNIPQGSICKGCWPKIKIELENKMKGNAELKFDLELELGMNEKELKKKK